MRGSLDKRRQIWFRGFVVLGILGFGLCVVAAHKCSHGHDHDHDHDDDHHHDLVAKSQQRKLLPEEIAEEEDLRMMWAHSDADHDIQHKHHHGQELSGLGLWTYAMACSLLVSLASLICLILLPIIFVQGKPSKIVVDSLALFGAGAMLGDAFLHQLPHAFGGEHSQFHDHHDDHAHHHAGSGHSHSHSLKDLSIGLSILGGVVIFLIVEKLVRYVEEFSGGVDLGHHHHHHHTHSKKLKNDNDGSPDEDHQDSGDNDAANGKLLNETSEEKDLPGPPSENANSGSEKTLLRKRNTSSSAAKDENESSAEISNMKVQHTEKKEPTTKAQSSLVFGYLNLFSDGVHNFTDGMALGSAFLVYGSVGGWSRTLFLLAHELPQEIGDFGILVRSGFSVSKALLFNFLSALVALAGTALALLWGRDPGQSSLIEGFTAGGFIYIALAGVLAEMNTGTAALRHTAIQLVSLLSGMAVALCISLVE